MSQLDKLKEKEKTSYIEECIIWALKTDADKTAAIAELNSLRSERDALKVVVQAAKYWRKSWPDEKDVLEAKEESCPCAICELIRACDALAGDE